MSSEFNIKLGEKLRMVRDQLGLTLEEVAAKMGFKSYQILLSIENGSRPTKSQELAKLAKIYNLSITSLLTVSEFAKLKVLWRGKSDSENVKLKEQEFLNYCRNYSFLENKLNIVRECTITPLPLRADDFDWNKIVEIATHFSREWQLGARPACVLRKVLEEKCFVKILYLDLGTVGSAASAVGDFGSAILINRAESPGRRNFNLAHELFHLLTWNIFRHEDIHYVGKNKSIVEKYADYFAACLLLPTDDVINEFRKKLQDNKISVLDIVSIAREFEVSTEALLWRLVGLKELSKEPVKTLIESPEFKELDLARRDTLNEPLYLSENYVGLAFRAYKKDLISKGKLAEFLGVSVGMVGAKLSEFGYIDEDGVYHEELTAA